MLELFRRYKRRWLSEVTGYHRNSLDKIASGRRRPSKKFRKLVAAAVSAHVDEESLFTDVKD